MREVRLFSERNVKVMTFIMMQLKNHKDVYGFRSSGAEVTVQLHYNANVAALLAKKKFKSSVSSVGYMTLSKMVGHIEINFVFTD